MEGKLRVAETEHLLDQRGANDLFGAHAFAPLSCVGLLLTKQVLANPLQDTEIRVERSAHGDEFFSPRMTALGCQRKLCVVEVAHRGLGSFFVEV